jgi:hypothetical protein
MSGNFVAEHTVKSVIYIFEGTACTEYETDRNISLRKCLGLVHTKIPTCIRKLDY